MTDEVVIDRQTLKALGADTLLEFLQQLAFRRRTLAELSSALEMSHSTVKAHMEVMQAAGLVNRLDEGRKWKYYTLTVKGYRIAAPQEVKALFVFAVSSIAAGAIGLRLWLSRAVPISEMAAAGAMERSADLMMAVPKEAETVAPDYQPYLLGAALLLSAGSLLFIAARRLRCR